MNPVLLNLADGTAFFGGMALVLLAEALLIRLPKRLTRSALTLIALIGIILVILSATPIPAWGYICWSIPALLGLILLNRAATSGRLRHIVCAVLLVSTVGLCIVEVPYHLSPQITVPDGTTVYVLGDSISAGVGTARRTAPSC